MGSGVKRRNKTVNKTVNKMFSGKITVEEAQRRTGGKAARKAAAADLAKAQQAQQARGTAGMDAALAGMAAELAPRRPVTEADIFEAIRTPMAVPSAAKTAKAAKSAGAAVPARRETPQQALKASGEMEAQAAMMHVAPRVTPMSSWTPVQRELWRQAHEHNDPQVRGHAWAALQKELAGPDQGAAKSARASARAIAWGAGPDGEAWRQVPQAAAPGLQIAVPGTAGR